MRTLIATVLVAAALLTSQATAQDKPNILVVWGDDIGPTNISANTHGLVGYDPFDIKQHTVIKSMQPYYLPRKGSTLVCDLFPNAMR